MASGLPSTRPQRMIANLLVWLITPGARDHGRDIGGAGDSLVGAEDRRDALEAVDAVLQGDDAGVRADQRRASSAAVSVSQSLTANSTTSTGPTLAGSSVTLTFGRCRSPCTLLILSPFLRMASRCAAAR